MDTLGFSLDSQRLQTCSNGWEANGWVFPLFTLLQHTENRSLDIISTNNMNNFLALQWSTFSNYIPIVDLLSWKHRQKDTKLYVEPSLSLRNKMSARYWWLTPIILTTQEAEIRRIMVQSQPRQIVYETLSWKYLTQKGLLEWLKV
jgi:hypothetical protein